uniref:Uncharacterized protein n=1 Tax=Sus scrofa TaxID=9823 RepID=A0A8D1ELC7_PIG
MRVLFAIQGRKTAIFTEAKVLSTTFQLKHLVQGILHQTTSFRKQMKSLRLCAESPSPAHLSCPM